MQISITAGAETTDDIVRFLFTPIYPWEDNLLMPEPTATAGDTSLLKTIRFLTS